MAQHHHPYPHQDHHPPPPPPPPQPQSYPPTLPHQHYPHPHPQQYIPHQHPHPPHPYPDPYNHRYEPSLGPGPGPGPPHHYDYPPPMPPHHYDYPPPVPHYPHYPPPPPHPSFLNPNPNTRPYKGHRTKRPRDTIHDSGAGEVQPVKKQAIGNDILFRVLVPSPQIGKVIGKAGHRVQKVRDDTKATIKIADPLARFEERVIIINSKEKSDGGVTDAEKALLQIASLILADDGSTAQPSSNSTPAASAVGEAHANPNAVKILIAGSQAGSLIGVSGQNIEKLRNSSGAAIAVLAASQLPMCASAHESDRLVQISGDSSAVLKAVEEIGAELRANPPKQVISISPTYNLSITRAAQSHMDPNAAECVTLDMVISETMIGGLIGKSGSNIGRIRSESGAMIKVYGGKGEQKHRQIQLIGTAPQVALAKQRVDEYVYTQLTQSGDE